MYKQTNTIANFTKYVFFQNTLSHRARSNRTRSAYAWLRDHKIKAFYTIIDGMKFEMAAKALLQTTGIGKLCPNVLMMGYKNDWRTCGGEELNSYFNLLQ